MSELSQLVERLRREAGFEVYLHAGMTGYLNDWHDDEGDKYNYVRAVHNLRNPVKGPISFIDNFATHAVRGKEGWEQGKGPTMWNLMDFDIVAYGALPKIVHLNVTRVEPSTKSVKAKGLKGVLGKREIVPDVKTTPTVVSVYKETQPLSDIVNTSSSDAAYYMRFTLRAVINTTTMGAPASLTIITNKNLVEQTIAYLERNPHEFYNFIRVMLPADQFPNVNRGILDRVQPADSIVFLNADKIDKQIFQRELWGNKWISGYGLQDWVYQTYGKRVEVKR